MLFGPKRPTLEEEMTQYYEELSREIPALSRMHELAQKSKEERMTLNFKIIRTEELGDSPVAGRQYQSVLRMFGRDSQTNVTAVEDVVLYSKRPIPVGTFVKLEDLS